MSLLFQMTPFPIRGKFALFHSYHSAQHRESPRAADAPGMVPEFFHREIVAIQSTAAGHFLMVLFGDELVSLREVQRQQNCDLIGIFEAGEISDQMEQVRHQKRGLAAVTPTYFSF